jgi:hypothetical protein
MVDFSQMLRKPAGEAKKPQALPIGDYPGVITGFEVGDNNKNKTPYVRYFVKLTGLAEGVDTSELDGADISKRQFRRDYYLTDDALWRMDEFLRSVGINSQGRTYEECLPEAVGAQVTAEVQQYMNQSNSEIGNQIGKLVGAR